MLFAGRIVTEKEKCIGTTQTSTELTDPTIFELYVGKAAAEQENCRGATKKVTSVHKKTTTGEQNGI